VLERRPHEVSGFDAAAALWLRQRRLRIALLIGSAEALIAFLSSGVIRIAVVVAATPLIGLYLFARTTIEWSLGQQLLWIVGASQAFAVLATVSTFVVGWWTALIAFAAVVALVLLLSGSERRR